MESALIRKADNGGRLLLPKQWRQEHGSSFIVLQMGDELRIIPRSRLLSDLPEIEADIKSPLTDWKKLKGELIGEDEIP